MTPRFGLLRWAVAALSLLWLVAAQAESYGPVRSGDSLWGIAGKTAKQQPAFSRQQWVIGLLRANPQAFRNSCNFNTLKPGSSLQIPGAEVLGQLSPAEAIREIERQQAQWKQRANAPLTCLQSAPQPAAPAEPAKPEPPKPATPADPVKPEPPKPATPADPVKPEPPEPAAPVESVKPKPPEPAAPVESVKPKPPKPAEPAEAAAGSISWLAALALLAGLILAGWLWHRRPLPAAAPQAAQNPSDTAATEETATSGDNAAAVLQEIQSLSQSKFQQASLAEQIAIQRGWVIGGFRFRVWAGCLFLLLATMAAGTYFILAEFEHFSLQNSQETSRLRLESAASAPAPAIAQAAALAAVQQAHDQATALLLASLICLAGVLLAAAALLAGLLYLALRDTEGFPSAPVLAAIVLGTAALAQLVYLGLALQLYQDHRQQALEAKTRVAASLLRANLQQRLDSGIALEALPGIPALLRERGAPELAALAILDSRREVLYQAGKAAGASAEEWLLPLHTAATEENIGESNLAGYLRVTLAAPAAQYAFMLWNSAVALLLLLVLAGGWLAAQLLWLAGRLRELRRLEIETASKGHDQIQQTYLQQSLRSKMLSSVLGLLVVAQAFNGGLSISAFEKLYVESLTASYQVVGRELQGKLENAVRFGKQLERFVGLTPLLESIRQKNPELANLLVANPNGQIVQSLEPWITDLPPALQLQAGESAKSVFYQDRYHVLLPVRDGKGKLAGMAALSFDNSLARQKVNRLILQNLRALGLITLLAGIVMIAGLTLMAGFNHYRQPSRLMLYSLLFTLLGLAQLFYAGFNIQLFQATYSQVIQAKAATLGGILQQDIEYLLGKGIAIDRLVKIDVMLGKMLEATPEITSAEIVDAAGQQRYAAQRPPATDEYWLPWRSAELPLAALPLRQGGKAHGEVRLHISAGAITSKIQEIVLDTLTVVIISFLFAMELVIFLFNYIRRLFAESAEIGSNIARPAAFLFLFGATLSYTFMPLYMASLYQPLAGFSREVVLGMPVAAEMFFGGITLIPVGIWIERRGWQQPFFAGIVLCVAGALLSGWASSPLELIAARAVMGVGYGFSWMSIQSFVLNQATSRNRARGIANLVAGIFSGTLCGSAVGGMLAQRFGYSAVFYVAAAVLILALLFSLLFLRQYAGKPSADSARFRWQELLRFVTDRQIFPVFMLSLLPNAICLVGLLYYFSPTYLHSQGVSQANISRAIMVFSLCMIYIAPLISPLVDRVENKKDFISIGGLLGGISLLLLYWLEGYWSVFAAILMLGLSVSLSAASRNVFTLNVEISRQLGVSKSMGIYRTVDKLGQTLGPVILGALMAGFAPRHAAGVVGVTYMIMTLLFIFSVQSKPAGARA